MNTIISIWFGLGVLASGYAIYGHCYPKDVLSLELHDLLKLLLILFLGPVVIMAVIIQAIHNFSKWLEL